MVSKKVTKTSNSGLAKKKVVKKVSKSTPTQAPVSEPVVPVTTAPVPTTSETITPVEEKVPDTVSNYATEFTHLLDQLRVLQTTLKDLTQYTQKLEKRVAKDQKAVLKRVNGKRKRATNSGSPSGFSKPGPISDELRSFLNIGKDELIARTEVTKRINTYCKDNKLQGEKDKRVLLPDKPLRKLLRLSTKDELTFFNLQKYMKIHFPNKEGVYPTA
jgi:chromatin remodeling complex protein RSC6